MSIEQLNQINSENIASIQKYKISIIEDSVIHTEWLKFEISTNPQYSVVTCSKTGREGIMAAKKHCPDLIFLDFQLEDMTGLEVAKRIKNYNEQLKIFCLTAHTEISFLERIINDKNIDGLGIKGSSCFEINLNSSIKQVIQGGAYLDPSLLKILRHGMSANWLRELTNREFEIFIQTSSGKGDSQIAQDLCIEINHVKNLKSRITKKMRDNKAFNLISKIMRNSKPDAISKQTTSKRD